MLRQQFLFRFNRKYATYAYFTCTWPRNHRGAKDLARLRYANSQQIHLLYSLSRFSQRSCRNFSDAIGLNVKEKTSASEVLSNLSPEEEKRLKVLKLEYDVLLSTGVRVPDNVRDDDWLWLLNNCRTFSSRKKYYLYLFKCEKSEQKSQEKRALGRKLRDEKLKRLEQMKLDGSYESKNAIMLFTREQTMNRWYTNNLCYALMNGPNLVFDFSFEDRMTNPEVVDLVKQIQFCHGENKIVREPFHFHFSNLSPNGRVSQKLQLGIPNLSELPITVTDRNYLEFYDASRIVYLSPNAPNVMTEFRWDDVYVVGALVDKACEEPWSFAKAKKEKIRSVRFPLDRHVRWVQGSKSLTLNQVVKILLDLKHSNDWFKALTLNLPKRKFEYF